MLFVELVGCGVSTFGCGVIYVIILFVGVLVYVLSHGGVARVLPKVLRLKIGRL